MCRFDQRHPSTGATTRSSSARSSAEIGAHNPDWTDFIESDPVVTLVELFAFLADTVLWQLDEQKRRRRRQRVALLLLGTAGLAIWLTLNRPCHDAAPGRP